MHVKSAFIADGEVTSVKQITTETKIISGRLPFVRTKYEASFQIHSVIKWDGAKVKADVNRLDLIYWRTNEAQNKNEKLPILKQGDHFRLFF